MLTITLKGNVLHVREDIMSFHDTKSSHWYYDTKLHLRSLHGREGDVPIQHMTDHEVTWMERHHLPRARIIE